MRDIAIAAERAAAEIRELVDLLLAAHRTDFRAADIGTVAAAAVAGRLAWAAAECAQVPSTAESTRFVALAGGRLLHLRARTELDERRARRQRSAIGFGACVAGPMPWGRVRAAHRSGGAA